jgi:alkanesulfonate monooxygenase
MALAETLHGPSVDAQSKPLRFHWRLPYAGESTGMAMADQATAAAIGLPAPKAQIEFCRHAEECGIDSLLVDFGFAKPDPMLLAAILGQGARKIKFILAYRSGLFSPAMFVQQLNTLSALIEGRLLLNIVAGYSPEEQRGYGDFLSHDERYERTEEFLAACRAFWNGGIEVNFSGKHYRVEKGKLKTPFVSHDRPSPEIIIGGGSTQAQKLALREGTCWMQLADAPEKIRPGVATVLASGVEAGLRLCVISRPSHQEAVEAARALIGGEHHTRKSDGQTAFIQKTDSVSFKAAYQRGDDEWLTPTLWTGAVRVQGPTAISLVGSPDEIADAFMEYKDVGISQFILSGWPKLAEMTYFGQDVLPRIRQKEAERAAQSSTRSRASVMN